MPHLLVFSAPAGSSASVVSAASRSPTPSRTHHDCRSESPRCADRAGDAQRVGGSTRPEEPPDARPATGRPGPRLAGTGRDREPLHVVCACSCKMQAVNARCRLHRYDWRMPTADIGRTPPANLFTPQFGYSPHQVVGRDRLLGDIEAAMRTLRGAKHRSTLVMGPRGAGKTVLLNTVEAQATAPRLRRDQRGRRHAGRARAHRGPDRASRRRHAVRRARLVP